MRLLSEVNFIPEKQGSNLGLDKVAEVKESPKKEVPEM